MWTREWRKLATNYVMYDDEIIFVPDYVAGMGDDDPFPVADHIRETAFEVSFTDVNRRNHTLPVTMPEAEAAAALWLLDDPQPGRFGYIHSGAVREVLDDQTLVLTHIHLVDWEPVYEQYQPLAEQLEAQLVEMLTGRKPINPNRPLDGLRLSSQDEADRFDAAWVPALQELRRAMYFQYGNRYTAARHQNTPRFAHTRWRIIGYPTDEAVQGARWPHNAEPDAQLKLVIVAVEPNGTVVAAPLSHVEEGLTELQLLEVMESRQVSKAQVYEWIMASRREHRREYLQPVLAQIEANAPIPHVAAAVREEGEQHQAATAQTAEGRGRPSPNEEAHAARGADDEAPVEANGSQEPSFFGLPVE